MNGNQLVRAGASYKRSDIPQGSLDDINDG